MFLQRSNSIHTKVASKQPSAYWPVDVATTDYAWFYEIIGYLVSNPLRIIRLLQWRSKALNERRHKITLTYALLSDYYDLLEDAYSALAKAGSLRAVDV
jgi:hypothetical protein